MDPMKRLQPEDDWEQRAELIRKFSERLLKAGWATAVGYDEHRLAIRWTKHGNEQILKLWNSYEQLRVATFKSNDFRLLWEIVAMDAKRRGWDAPGP